MQDYIDFSLSINRFNEVIEALEKLCELSDDYMEIERYFILIRILNNQKDEYYSKRGEELRKEFGFDQHACNNSVSLIKFFISQRIDIKSMDFEDINVGEFEEAQKCGDIEHQ